MEKIVKNKAVILFYVVMVMMTYLMMGRLEQLNQDSIKEQSIVYAEN